MVAPAKVNGFLCVHGRRWDGFHALSSIVLPLGFGDELEMECAEANSFRCDNNAVPQDESNLVCRAIALFRSTVPDAPFFRCRLTKEIPVGAGLGGGSSDAATALLMMNSLAGEPLRGEALEDLAAKLGSDCPLFIRREPIVMRGRGELLSPVSQALRTRLMGTPVVVFKPSFPIMTQWAYESLAEATAYTDESLAAKLLDAWEGLSDRLIPGGCLYNDFERIVTKKYIALGVLLRELREGLNVAVLLSGSGSACFAFPRDEEATIQIRGRVKEALGEGVFWVETFVG